jgi:hypothetical protein
VKTITQFVLAILLLIRPSPGASDTGLTHRKKGDETCKPKPATLPWMASKSITRFTAPLARTSHPGFRLKYSLVIRFWDFAKADPRFGYHYLTISEAWDRVVLCPQTANQVVYLLFATECFTRRIGAL